jgi:chemotaxis protein methyltransferase CheR
MSDLPLSAPVFAILSSLIEERAGLSFNIDQKELLAEKVSVRASENGFDSLLDYYYFLRYDPGSASEFETLITTLVVNETFFFRELLPLQAVVAHVVVPLLRAGHSPRIWSAACSTGEEPLTLAMLLAELDVLDRVEIVATDISQAALERARSGQHPRRAVRQLPAPPLAAKWLELHEDRVVDDPRLRAAIQWRQLNLLDQARVRELGRFDVILCRNVLIYFKDAVTVRVVTQLAEQLRSEGVLLVGVSESLMRLGTALVCEELSGAFVYRKAPG